LLNEESISLHDMALMALDDAKFNFENDRYYTSINRSYYAVFYMASALLEKKKIKTKKHAGTIHQFGLAYVVNDDFNEKIASFFSILFKRRERSDYNIFQEINDEMAEDSLEKAEIFLKESEMFI
jgi:uncharacterized protein (UPF0332 family)